MNKSKKALYESIMMNISKQVKKALTEAESYIDVDDLDDLEEIDHPDYGHCTLVGCFDPDKGDFYEVYDEDECLVCELPYGTINMADEDAIIDAIDDAVETDDILYDNGIDVYEDDESTYEDDTLDESYMDDFEWDEYEEIPSEKYTLVGIDGNAFSIMGYVAQAMKKEGKSKEDIREYQKDAMKDDYNHLLMVSQKMIDELNEN